MFPTAVAVAIALAIAATWAVAPPGGPPAEGVGVHGYWTIDVHDPDGSLAVSHEFDNAFVGFAVLSKVLAGEDQLVMVDGVPEWGIVVDGGLCDSAAGLATSCRLGLAGTTRTVVQFQTLEVSRDSDLNLLSLQGTFEADNSGDITSVYTTLYLDERFQTGTPPEAFTKKNFDHDAVAVSAGQFVTVTVDISFSDAPA